MMLNWFRKSSEDAFDPRDAEIRALKQKVEFHASHARSAEAAHRVANEVASQRAARIIRLEADLADQSTKITTLSNLNTKLERELRPFTVRRRGARGQFVSTKQVSA